MVVDTSGKRDHQAEGGVLRGLDSPTDPGGSRRVPAGEVDCSLGTFPEAKTLVWEEFGEAMERRFWQTIRKLRRGKLHQHGVLLTSMLAGGRGIGGSTTWLADRGSPFEKGGPEGMFQSFLVRSNTGALVKRVRLIVEPQIQEEQWWFGPGHGRLDQLYTLIRVLEGAWEFGKPIQM